jgi:hypothetical protein
MCVQCITTKAGLSASDIYASFDVLGRVLVLRRDPDDRCRACGTVGEVYWIERPVQ